MKNISWTCALLQIVKTNFYLSLKYCLSSILIRLRLDKWFDQTFVTNKQYRVESLIKCWCLTNKDGLLELDQMLVSYQQIWLDSLIKCWCLTNKDGLWELDQMLVSYQQIWLDSLIKCWCLTSKDGLRERELDTGPLKRVLKHCLRRARLGTKDSFSCNG